MDADEILMVRVPKQGGKFGSKLAPQQVEQWIKDIEVLFEYTQVLVNSTTRTLWAVRTIQFNTHHKLLQQRLSDRPTPSLTWSWLKAKECKLVQDPVLTKFDNFVKFFNFEWHSNNTVSSFLLCQI
ncbi:hypothetical protein EJ02DRAFT_422177 [Clathrospora elynae]|uniref:Uncharacterized protein n=1 Tax=Clathrospora elynae TaxID=706981 RepID=A0A6A5SPB5_9PLEO|nr:hypothetical protein EJ02DRAFT_422177 [Clathrospora elynae]